MKKLILLSSLIILASCTTKTPIVVALKCPEPLILPKLSEELASQVQMMTPELRQFFLYRDKIQIARRETLQEICRSTQ